MNVMTENIAAKKFGETSAAHIKDTSEKFSAAAEQTTKLVQNTYAAATKGIKDYNLKATNMSRPAKRVVAFYNKRGTCEQWIKEGKGAIKWTRLSCRTFAANAVRLQLHALAYDLGNFLRTLATPEPIKDWSLTSLKEKLIKIGAKVVSHGRYVAFQMAEVAIPRQMFQEICG
jgi:Transposase DDE domain group 1